VCIGSLAKMALPVSSSDVVIMRVTVDRGDLEINLVLKHWELGVVGGGTFIFHFPKVLSMIVTKVLCQQKSLCTI